MYLTLLNKEEKNLFLSLAYQASIVDGEFGIEEQELLRKYCEELAVDESQMDKSRSLEQILATLVELSDFKSKKIILFEIVGLIMIDGKNNASEEKLVSYIAKRFGLEVEYLQSCKDIVLEYIEFQGKINNIVLG